MGKLHTLLHLSPSGFLKLALLIPLVLYAALRVRFLPPGRVVRDLQTKTFPDSLSKQPRNFSDLEPWIRLLEAVDRNLGAKSSCLRRALVLSWLSRFWKIPVEFKIGVRRDGETFEAHTWLESGGVKLEIQPSPVFLPLQDIPRS